MKNKRVEALKCMSDNELTSFIIELKSELSLPFSRTLASWQKANIRESLRLAKVEEAIRYKENHSDA